MSTPASALPSVMQGKLEGMRAAAQPPAAPTPAPTGTVVPPTQPTVIPNTPPAPPTPAAVEPPATPPATPPAPTEGERISLSREEYNNLRAGQQSRDQAVGRAELLQLELEEARARLTELEKGSKASPQPSEPSPPTPAVTLTEEELRDFADSKPFIEKVATLVASQLINAQLSTISQRLDAIEQTAQGAHQSVTATNQRSFMTQVLGKVPNMQELIKHQHWGDFANSTEPLTGMTYGALLGHNVQNQRLDAAVKIYKQFEQEYVAPLSTNTNDGQAAYAGAAPTGGAGTPPPAQPTPKLKFSDRKKASLDYRHGRISPEELRVVDEAFKAADKLGNVDYSA